MRKTLPTTARGKPMDVPPGTGFGICGMTTATGEERANVERSLREP
jgi:hypothetical protein